MLKFFKFSLAATLLLLLLGLGGFWIWGQVNLAAASPAALAALNAEPAVSVNDETWVVFKPKHASPRTGVIFYPGANCDPRGYAPVFTRIAKAGYLVVDVPMPFNFAIFGPDKARKVMESYPDIKQWIIMGHSMGGAMASTFADHHTESLAGVILWDSYPPTPNDLSQSGLNVWHIHRARADGSPPEKFSAMRTLFPADSRWVPIPGGIHMNFGSFDGGGYEEEWEPGITQQEQHDLVTRATLDAIRDIAG